MSVLPKDKMNHVLVWSKDGILKAAEASESPGGFTFNRRWFDLNKFDLGDVDYLRNEKGQLVGFCYILGDLEKNNPIINCIVSQSNQSYIKDGFLFIFLHPCKKFEIETVQGIGTSIYYDNADAVILLIPNLGTGELAFDLTSDDVPVACNL